jgi:hypothetical protein
MSWFLRVQDGKEFRDAAVLVEGKSVIIGRAETADVAFPNDGEMSSRHVSVTLRDGQCVFSDLHSTNGTFLDREAVSEGTLSPGSHMQCGLTIFTVESGQATRPKSAPLAATKMDSPSAVTGTAKSKASLAATAPASVAPTALPQELLQTKGFVSEDAAQIVERFGLAEGIAFPPHEGESPEKFADRLLASGDDNDCLNFLAYALPKRLGVWWALECLRSEDGLLAATDAEIVDAVTAWVAAPSDETRRHAMELAEANGMETAAAWAAVTAFWSHGSMGPKGQPNVPAADEMAGKALSGSVILASVVTSPENAPQRRKTFVDIANKIASGTSQLPAAGR